MLQEQEDLAAELQEREDALARLDSWVTLYTDTVIVDRSPHGIVTATIKELDRLRREGGK